MASGDRTNKIAIEIHGERCLHARSPISQCSLCVNSCPGGALQFEGRGKAPVLVESRCMQCGQCLTACPLEVFESPSFTERQLVNRIEGPEPVCLRCFLPYGQLETIGREVRTYQLGACLAALSPGVLFELAVARPVELYVDRCPDCGLFERLRPTFEANVTAAFRMLHGVRASANLTEGSPLFLPQIPVTFDEETVPPRPSARSLFNGGRVRRDSAKRRRVLALRQRNKHVPAWRKRVGELWARRGFNASGACDYAWTELVVDAERCRGCGVCMQMCPTGSISQSLDEGVFTYSFTPGTCVNCGLCLTVCPEAALSRDYRACAQPFQPVDCFSRAASVCERCGLPVLEGRGERLCAVCEAQRQRPSLIFRIRAQLGIETPGEAKERIKPRAQGASDAEVADVRCSGKGRA